MKRILSLLLTLALTISLCPGGFGAESGPAAPSWMGAEDYLTFPGDPVYQPESWGDILAQRAQAEAGGLLPYEGREWVRGSVGQCYETALIRRRMAENYTDAFEAGAVFLAAGRAFEAAESGWFDQNRGKDETYYRLSVEKYRAYLIYSPDYVDNWGKGLVPALDALGMTLADFFAAPGMDRVSQEGRTKVANSAAEYGGFYRLEKDRVSVWLDGEPLGVDGGAQVKNQRVMVPVRALAEALGAEVTWDGADGVTLDRAGQTVTMTLGKTGATVDGKQVNMDVAPYAERGKTYLSVRWAAEFLGQKVTWNAQERRAEITEDKTEGGEDWALGMGALLMAAAGGDPARFGGWSRVPRPSGKSAAQTCREELEKWEVTDRESLLAALEEMEAGGHNADFLAAAQEVKHIPAGELKSRVSGMSEVDQYMWPRTQELWKKWGDQGIRAWDLCRAAAFAQWGYTAGYLTYGEALKAVGPAAEELRESFRSWDQVYENFLEGYYWCVRENLGDKDVLDAPLGRTWLYLKNSPNTRILFNSEMFENKE